LIVVDYFLDCNTCSEMGSGRTTVARQLGRAVPFDRHSKRNDTGKVDIWGRYISFGGHHQLCRCSQGV